MRKALLPTLLPPLASLLICGAAAGTLIATNAHAGQTTGKPVMMLAQNQPAPETARQAGPPPDMDEATTREPRRGQFCRNISALKAGELAFLETKLQLTTSQQPLFARWKDISMDIAKRHEGDCDNRVERLRAGQRRDMMERLDREEDRLKTRLADIQTERPALSTLYAALDPTQKEEFGRAARVGGRMHMAMGMMHHGRSPEMGRPFGRGPTGEPPLPPAQPQ
jgi:hypothetical protein